MSYSWYCGRNKKENSTQSEKVFLERDGYFGKVATIRSTVIDSKIK